MNINHTNLILTIIQLPCLSGSLSLQPTSTNIALLQKNVKSVLEYQLDFRFVETCG